MTLRDVDLYLKRRALVEAPGNAHEQAEARRQCQEMEAEHAGISEKARQIKAVLEGAQPPPDPTGGGIGAFLRNVASESASRFASEVAGEVTGTRRFDPLKSGVCRFYEHPCHDDQVCLEIRVNRRDVRRSRARDTILEGFEEELLRIAEE